MIGAGTFSGSPVRRIEDPPLLRGEGTFIDNLPIAGVLHLAFVRSTIAHADLLGVDTSAASAMPGVAGVFTADDLDLPDHVGFMIVNPAVMRPSLARGRVRFVGDPIAVVAADTKAHAVDAAEAVVVDYEPRPVAVDPESALAPDAPVLFDGLSTNVVAGSRDAEDLDPLVDADVVVRCRIENQRVAVMPMEGSAVAVIPGDDGAGHELTIYLSCQGAHGALRNVAEAFDLDAERIRVIAPHVGGSFGGKQWSPEDIVAIGLARHLGRPVKWIETRSENLQSFPHGRGQLQFVELGLQRDGTIVGLRCRMIGDGGAYAGFGGMLPMLSTWMMAQGVYRIPAISYSTAVAVTNTTPMGAYRGAGRPEAAAMLERIIDVAADELGIDPVELRRRNLLRPDEFPHRTLTGVTYDTGDYDGALTEALRVAGYDELRAEQAQRRERGDVRQLGIGVSTYVEVTAGGSPSEFAEVSVDVDGDVTIAVGTSAHGQGHATAFSTLVSERFGVPLERIRFVQADTALVARGNGTGGSRSLQFGGSAVLGAADRVLDRARELAADVLEAAAADIVLEDGRFSVVGTPARSLSWAEVASAAVEQGDPLTADHDFVQGGPTFPFGAHVSVVEVDLETGRVVPVRHIAVDDCGRIFNPLLVHGQIHGGVASGIAQALWEQFVYDEDGNPMTSTLAEYSMPSAAELPSFEVADHETPTPLNPLGAKGIGESATVGSTAAVHNAVVDALSHLGVRHIDMPCTPERVWRTIEAARTGGLPSPWREPPDVFSSLPRRPSGRPAGADVDL